MNSTSRTLRLILGDQLNHHHSWFSSPPGDAEYLMMEVRSETDYCVHHIQKVIAFFLAMRAFAAEVRAKGFTVHYLTLDDPQNCQSLGANVAKFVKAGNYGHFEYQLPDELRVDEALKATCSSLSIPTSAIDTEHFYTTRHELQTFFKGKRQYLMESFYRGMRQKHNVLMEDRSPIGGAWNFDASNRKKLPESVRVPPQFTFQKDATELERLIHSAKVRTMGSVDASNFTWATTRSDALSLLEYFCNEQLPLFGTYQDAMSTSHNILFHSQLSFVMNVKLISPKEVVERAISEWRTRPDAIEISQIEGFVRQILGWREYMRGMYWALMPDFKSLNYLNGTRPLPSFYWDGNTKMRCLHHAITQSLTTGYAHHIQRLMITGNFALLAGVHPDEVDAWYLGIYNDAVEWVQITNTRGMSQFADGGKIATKPYVSSANYIHKMSNYCDGCFYSHKERVGERACPFNSLYWCFFQRHRDTLSRNPRIGMAYRTLDAMDTNEVKKIEQQALHYLSRLDEL